LDEMDNLVTRGKKTLSELSIINSELNTAKVSMIGILNDPAFTELLDTRVKSSLSEEEIKFPPYNANQLQDILTQRAEIAFNKSVIKRGVIPLCAAFAAQEHGNAMLALDLLRTSGEIVEGKNLDVITVEHVRLASEKIETDWIAEVVKILSLQLKIVLSCLLSTNRERNKGPFTSGEVYNIYLRLCSNLGIKASSPRRVQDVISELDILGLINAVKVSKGKYGNTREISLCVPEVLLQLLLVEDPRLKAISNIKVTA